MLVAKENDFKDKIVSIKLSNGEEIIAECVDNIHDEKTIKILQPLSLVVGSSPNGTQAQVSFAPWMLSLAHGQIIDLKKTHILFMAEAGADASKQYKDATKK